MPLNCIFTTVFTVPGIWVLHWMSTYCCIEFHVHNSFQVQETVVMRCMYAISHLCLRHQYRAINRDWINQSTITILRSHHRQNQKMAHYAVTSLNTAKNIRLLNCKFSFQTYHPNCSRSITTRGFHAFSRRCHSHKHPGAHTLDPRLAGLGDVIREM